MDPNAIAELLQSASATGAIPPAPIGMMNNQNQPESPPSFPDGESQDFFPLLAEALDKLQNMGVPFVGDITNLLLKGGGSQQSWASLLKAIDAYGKHKNSVVADNVRGVEMANNPQPPGSYQI